MTPNPVDSDPLFVPTLADRKVAAGEPPWRLESLYLLAFFGGGGAAAWIASRNAIRLGMTERDRRRLLLLGGSFILLHGAFLGCLAGYLGDLDGAQGLTDPNPLRFQSLRSRLSVSLASVGLTAILVRIQVRADRLYQIDVGRRDRYSSLWKAGIGAAAVTLVATIAVAASVYALFGLVI